MFNRLKQVSRAEPRSRAESLASRSRGNFRTSAAIPINYAVLGPALDRHCVHTDVNCIHTYTIDVGFVTLGVLTLTVPFFNTLHLILWVVAVTSSNTFIIISL